MVVAVAVVAVAVTAGLVVAAAAAPKGSVRLSVCVLTLHLPHARHLRLHRPREANVPKSIHTSTGKNNPENDQANSTPHKSQRSQ